MFVRGCGNIYSSVISGPLYVGPLYRGFYIGLYIGALYIRALYIGHLYRVWVYSSVCVWVKTNESLPTRGGGPVRIMDLDQYLEIMNPITTFI